MIAAWLVVVLVAGGLVMPPAAVAQLPGGMQMPGGLPTGGLSKDSLLQQAKSLLSDLTSMKNSDKLGAAQKKQVDGLLPKAQSLHDELDKPQVETSRLAKLGNDLGELQKQVGVLKNFLK